MEKHFWKGCFLKGHFGKDIDMSIIYKEINEIPVDQIEELILSVAWESGKYPERIEKALRNSSLVISAWDGDKLVGLVRSLDDGELCAFIHYLLDRPDYQGYHIGAELMNRLMSHYTEYLYVKIMPSDPKTIPFYQKFGFEIYDNYSAMERKNFT